MKIALPFAKNASAASRERTLRAVAALGALTGENTATWAGYGLAFAVVAALAAVSLGARWP